MVKPTIAPSRGVILLMLLSTVVLFLAVVSLVKAQQCISSSPLAPELRNRPPDANGIIHVSYSFNDPNISQASKDAILNALGQWNGVSNSTHVVFDQAAPGAFPDLEFKGSDNAADTGGCAAYRPSSTRVFYSPG